MHFQITLQKPEIDFMKYKRFLLSEYLQNSHFVKHSSSHMPFCKVRLGHSICSNYYKMLTWFNRNSIFLKEPLWLRLLIFVTVSDCGLSLQFAVSCGKPLYTLHSDMSKLRKSAFPGTSFSLLLSPPSITADLLASITSITGRFAQTT